MPPRSPTTVGMAVETTVISMAAIDKLSSRATTVSGRLVFIAVCTMLLRAGRLVVQWQVGGNAAPLPCRARGSHLSWRVACLRASGERGVDAPLRGACAPVERSAGTTVASSDSVNATAEIQRAAKIAGAVQNLSVFMAAILPIFGPRQCFYGLTRARKAKRTARNA